MKVDVKKRVIGSVIGIIILTMSLALGLYFGHLYLNGCQGLHDRAYSRCQSSPVILPIFLVGTLIYLLKEIHFLFTTAKRFYGAKGKR
jgi:hypothetical protein